MTYPKVLVRSGSLQRRRPNPVSRDASDAAAPT
jgi:hypothetical protein